MQFTDFDEKFSNLTIKCFQKANSKCDKLGLSWAKPDFQLGLSIDLGWIIYFSYLSMSSAVSILRFNWGVYIFVQPQLDMEFIRRD